jgi:hypothetical protein
MAEPHLKYWNVNNIGTPVLVICWFWFHRRTLIKLWACTTITWGREHWTPKFKRMLMQWSRQTTKKLGASVKGILIPMPFSQVFFFSFFFLFLSLSTNCIQIAPSLGHGQTVLICHIQPTKATSHDPPRFPFPCDVDGAWGITGRSCVIRTVY